MDGDEIQVFYPTWIKVMGIIFLPIMAGVSIWLGLRPLWEVDLTDAQIVLFPIMGIAVFYQCTIGFRCFKYFGTVLVLHDKGVDSYNKGKVEEYTWGNLEVKEYAFATTTQIKCKNGKTLAYFSDGLPNLKLLVETIENGIT
jgi:hypothetical protein